MLLRLLPNRISWLAASLAVMLGTNASFAQEVGFVDLTQIVARTELRHPAPRSDEATDRRGGGSIADLGHDDCDVPNAPKDAGTLRTTLVWLDRDEYAVGDHQKFEVRIENVGSVPVEMPFSPHLADLQPVDASQKFGYSVVRVELWIGGARWDESDSTWGEVALYGASQYPGTMLTMHPGEWVRIIGRGKITRSEEVMRFIRNGDAVNHANAQVSIHRVETLLTATASATISHGVCPNRTQGPSVAMQLDVPK
jgi:hypothetical protein